MKNTSFLIVSLLASTHVYGVSKSDHLRRSKDMYEKFGSFLPADETMRLMNSTNQKLLKNRLDESHNRGQTTDGHFHVYQIANRVIAKRIPTPANNTTAQIDLEQFLRDNNIKARQLDLVSPTLDGTQDPMTISPNMLKDMGVKTLTVKGMLEGDCTDYKDIKVIADTIVMPTNEESLYLENIHADQLTLRPSTDIDLKVSGCDIDTLVLDSQHQVNINPNNGIKNVRGTTGEFSLNGFMVIVNRANVQLSPLPIAEEPTIDYGMTWNWKISKTVSKKDDVVTVEDIGDGGESSALFGPVAQLINDKNIKGDILHITSKSQVPIVIPHKTIDAMGVTTLYAQGCGLTGDYSGKDVLIAPDTEEVTLGPIKADKLALFAGPKTKYVNFGGDLSNEKVQIQNDIYIQPSNNIMVNFPAGGDLDEAEKLDKARMIIRSHHDVMLLDNEVNDSVPRRAIIVCPTLSFKGTRYQVDQINND